MKLKRREMLVAAVAAGTVRGKAAEQENAAPADLAAQARKAMQANREAIAKVKLPIDAEPAFVFEA